MVKYIYTGFSIFAAITILTIASAKITATTPITTTSSSTSLDTLEQMSVITESVNPNSDIHNQFWLDSGAFFYIFGNTYHTIIGDLPTNSYWRLLYADTNPTDTDTGYHPQNIFRLLTKNKLTNISEEVYFLIVNDNLSTSPNRLESNGLLLMSRYMDSNNLYYAGIRVDGTAVIKKKIDGVYYTLAQTPLFDGNAYNRNMNPSLLPKNTWIGLRVTVVNTDKANTNILLFVDRHNNGLWKKILSYTDWQQNGVSRLTTAGYGGIRSDFMDVKMRDYHFLEIIPTP